MVQGEALMGFAYVRLMLKLLQALRLAPGGRR